MKLKDDFDWAEYPTHYERIMHRDFFNQGIDYIVDDFRVVNGNLVIWNNIHDNWREIYRLIWDLDVRSAYECGCGPAFNLINIHKMMPYVGVNGGDISKDQIDLGYKYFHLDDYYFCDTLKVVDFSKPVRSIGKYGFVFTNAVVMHLSHNGALTFLKNMGDMSNKYIFLVENTTCHDFDSLIKEALPDFKKIENRKHIDYGILLEKI